LNTFKTLTIAAAVLLLSGSCSQEPEHQTIYLIRHAEKVLTDTTDNPPLTDEGHIRAQEIAEIIDPKSIDRIYTTEYQRNLQTIAPLAEASDAEVKYYEWHDWQPMLAEIRANSLRLHHVAICGHGDNLLPMIAHLGGEPPLGSLGDFEHDKMFKVLIYGDTTLVEMITY
jgi:phosphohistidine phosphatase SixA